MTVCLAYTLKSIQEIRKSIQSFKPDICISHASPYLAFVTSTKRIPHIMFNDTEGAFLFHQIVKYLKPSVYSPDSFAEEVDLHTFPSFMELAYLHPDVFQVDEAISEKMGRKKYILLRFVANKATHDIGHVHLNDEYKRELVKTLEMYGEVKISSEDSLPQDLLPYKLDVHPSKIHDVIAGASLLVGEGATMCSEAAMLGVPSVFINQNKLGYITELDEKYELIDHFMANQEGRRQALARALALLKDPNTKEVYKHRRQKMLGDKQNLTELMINIVEKMISDSEANHKKGQENR